MGDISKVRLVLISDTHTLQDFVVVPDGDILIHAGKISHDMAKAFSEAQYEQYSATRIRQADTLETDFDRVTKHQPTVSRKKPKGNGKA